MGGLRVKNNQPVLARLLPFIQPNHWQQAQWQTMVDSGRSVTNQEDGQYTSLEWLNQQFFCKVQAPDIDHVFDESLSMKFDSYRLVFFNGEFCIRRSDWIPNVRVRSLSAMSRSESFKMSRMVQAESIALLTDATATSGVVIEVCPGVVLDKPIYLFHLNSGGANEVCSYRHHVIAGKFSSCEVVEHHLSLNQGGGVSFSRLTACVEAEAHYYHTKLVEEGMNQHHFAHNDMVVQRGGAAYSTTVILEGQIVRHQTSGCLSQDNGYAEINSLALPRRRQLVDSRSYLWHQSPHCQSRQTPHGSDLVR